MADLETRDIFQSYISKVFINVNTNNDDVVKITTQKFSPAGDVYELDRRVISPSLIETEKSLEELKPEVSNVYPFAVVPPKDPDGSVVILSPTIQTNPTASQNYYVPIYFERYDLEILRQLDKEFSELSTGEAIDNLIEGEG
jgi:DNA topoisomerase VI subunit B